MRERKNSSFPYYSMSYGRGVLYWRKKIKYVRREVFDLLTTEAEHY
jgi:hypothetical protein